MDFTDSAPAAGDEGPNQYVQAAQKHWLGSSKPITRVPANILKSALWDPLETEDFASSSLTLLESLQAFESYLWPGFNDDSPNTHVLLLVVLTNVKQRQSLPAWSLFQDRPELFAIFFRRVLNLLLDTTLSFSLRTHVLVFIIGAFQSLDNGLIRKECAPLVSIAVWHNLHSENVRNSILEKNPQFKKAWRAAGKRYDNADDSTKARSRFERAWLYTLVLDFLDLLYNAERKQKTGSKLYCERFKEFLSDLLSQFPTRRYVNTLLRDLNILVAVKLSPLYKSQEGGLFRDFFMLLRHYMVFPIDDHTGQQQSRTEVSDIHSSRIARLQRTALRNFREKLKLLALSSQGLLYQRSELLSHFEVLNDDELTELATLLGFRTAYPESISLAADRSFIMEVILYSHEAQMSFQDNILKMPILPTEHILYEESFKRSERYHGSEPLALPKLNLQYLTIGDFLWRSFILMRCEALFEIKSHLAETVKRLQPPRDHSAGQERVIGTRMALPVSKPAIVEVVPPRVGESIAAEVKAEVNLNMSRIQRENVRQEWESLRPDDVVYLLAVDHRRRPQRLTADSSSGSPAEEAPYQLLRAAEVISVLDESGRPLRHTQHEVNGYGPRHRRSRRLLLKLDAQQYQKDIAKKSQADVYDSINFIVRRQNRENNFKPILESIRRLALSDAPLPSWLQDVFLGMGDPTSATYKRLPNALESIDFRDTFLDWQHLRDSLPWTSVEAESRANGEMKPPFVLRSVKEGEEPPQENQAKRQKQGKTSKGQVQGSAEGADKTQSSQDPTASKTSKKRRREEIEEPSAETVKVSTYRPLNMGPYPIDAPKPNTVRFTPAQVEAIKSGTQPGLTVIVGPPGTGKTDVATQIINNIYHNFPRERILLVAHSNQALNQLFQKIAVLDIDERHLLRLGHGEGDLRLDADTSYSKYGRVEHFLEQGTRLLSEVSRLAASIDAVGAHGDSCETAEYFNTVHIQPLWTRYLAHAQSDESTAESIREAFPFHIYFSTAPQPLFPPDASKEQALEIALGCYRHISKLFLQLSDIRPFEILKSERSKANYLLVKEARIIALTSTYAAMRRQEIANLGFRYDNVVMEEAAQIKEIETFIPFALQKSAPDPTASSQSQLKRIVLLGDHLQNAPILSSQPLSSYANLSQSLFLRLIRLRVPHITLDAQGRARPSIANLYRWRYQKLTDLPLTQTLPQFTTANPGLRYAFQFINVNDYKGAGERSPTPHYYQNLGEAEYVVAMYMYMRLLSYPAHSISIITPYAGQRALIREVLAHRCGGENARLFGFPRSVSTVDKYQGEQNEYVLLSLVRTSNVGYLRDMRRLTVALSRARLGVYVFGRRDVFEGVPEIERAFRGLFERDTEHLRLVTGEMWPCQRGVDDDVPDAEEDGEGEVKYVNMHSVEHLGQYVYDMTQAKLKAIREGTERIPRDNMERGMLRIMGGEEESDLRGERVIVGGGSSDEDEEEEGDVDGEDGGKVGEGGAAPS